MKKKTTFCAALATSMLLFTAFACTQKDDDNAESLALLALAAAGNGQEQASQAQAVSSAISTAVTTSVTSGDTTAFAETASPDSLLARTDLNPSVIPTVLTNNSGGGSCTYSSGTYNCDMTISGTATCTGGGTMTMSGFKVKLSGNFTSGLTVSESGDVTFASCGVTYLDYATGAYKSAVLTGGVNLDYSGTLTTSGSSPITIGSVTTSVVTNKGVTVNGSSAAFSTTTIETNVSGTYTVSVTSTTSTVSSTLSGTVKVNGAVVKSYDGVTETTTCTTSGSEVTCTTT
ncbi:MAG: hypothetical protein KDK33_00030 [Leptospiraceae bacterium]|nr:hypothetical protein [Leptospiraceae bacterium]